MRKEGKKAELKVRKAELQVREKEMKVRKKEIKVRKKEGRTEGRTEENLEALYCRWGIMAPFWAALRGRPPRERGEG